MALNWLKKITNPPPTSKSRVFAQDMQAEGIPLNQPQASLDDLMTVTPKGNIQLPMIGRIFASMPTVRAAADMIANYASTPPMVVKARNNRSSQWMIDEDTLVARMLQWVNAKITPVEYIRKLAYFNSIYDCAWVAVEESAAEYKQYSPLSLYPMNPAFVEIIPDPEKGIRYLKYKPLGSPEAIYYREDQCIFMKGFSPFDDYHGLSKVNALEYDINKERQAKRYINRFFTHATTFSGVLTSTGEGEDEIQKIRMQVEENYRGANKSFRILVLEEGQKYENIPSSGIEVSAMPIIKDTNEMTAMVFGVPAGLLFGGVSSNDDIEALEELFWNRTILPLLEIIAQAHTKKLCLPISTQRKKLKTEFDLRKVVALKRQRLNEAKVHMAYQNSGTMLPNEVRGELNLDEHSGENAEFGKTAVPVFNAKQAEQQAANRQAGPGSTNGTSPSLTLPGTEGGRDQSDDGEAALVDETGRRSADFEDLFRKVVKEDVWEL